MVPTSKPIGSRGAISLPSAAMRQACLVSTARLDICVRETEAMLANASPRKPKLATDSKSSKVEILLVAWRVKAKAKSS